MQVHEVTIEYRRRFPREQYGSEEAYGRLSATLEDSDTLEGVFDALMDTAKHRVHGHLSGELSGGSGEAKKSGTKKSTAKAPAKAKKKAEPEPESEPEPATKLVPTSEPEPKTAENVQEISDNDLVNEAQTRARNDQSPKFVQKLMDELGASRLTEIQQEDRAEFVRKLREE